MKTNVIATLFILMSMLCISQNLPKVAFGSIKRLENFRSQYVDARNVDVWLPDGYDISQKYNVVYMQDGQMLFDSAQSWNKKAWGVDSRIAQLIRENKIEKCIVVGIWNNGKYRFSEYFPQKFLSTLSEDFRKEYISAYLQNKPQSDNYLKFIVDELKPFIDAHFYTDPGKDHTFLMGSSMGGMISMYAICEYPGVFGGAACLSIAWISMDKKNFELPLAGFNYLQKNAPSPNGHKIYMDHGTNEMDSLYADYQNFVNNIMSEKGFDTYNFKSMVFKNTGHNETDWSKRLSIPLEFLMPLQESLNEKYQKLPFGSIKPSGWLKTQMQKDMEGFVGNLDKLVPDLMNDPIYGAGRLQKNSRAKDLGNLKSGDAQGDEQYKWWNSETQSNWWDGYIRNAMLLDDQKAIEKVKTYISRILTTQDEDGYLGIYGTDLRYKFTSENGELWSKTTLYRGLLAYYESSRDEKVWNALVRAVDNVMQNYPVNRSQPFYAGKDFSGGVAHGLTFTDVLDRMHQLSGERKYLDYARFLYLNFSENYSSEKDARLGNILNPDFKLQSHGVHTYEHLRPLLVAAYASGNKDLQKALKIYLERISNCTTMTGGAIGDEWIDSRTADATQTGYEYCSLHELMDSYADVLQKSGDPAYAGKIEQIFYNAAQGSRHPDHSCIAYLKTDNSYEMMGTKNGKAEPGRKQTRYKYSAVHQDVAVCCAPNAGRISPYFLQSSWMKEGERTLVAMLLGPNVLKTDIQGIPVRIEEITEYPFQQHFVFKIHTEKTLPLKLKIRKPQWAIAVRTNEKYTLKDGFMLIDRTFGKDDQVELEFLADVLVKEDLNREKYFTYGALVYARPIVATEMTGKIYAPGFEDLNYKPADSTRYEYLKNLKISCQDGKIRVNLKNVKTKKTESVELIPFGKTILRQVSFK